MKARILSTVASAALMAGLSSGAHAQSAPAAAPEATANQGSAIEDIVVTAQRRSESLQSVPVTVTALNAASLARSGISQTSDLQVVTPGLVWSTALSTPTPFIRGVGSRDNSAANENGVATYVDGIYYAAMPGGLLALPNIERIEVLKGPQGTLFGRNANGGLIQIITKDPPSEFSGTAKLGYSNYATVTGSLYMGGPVTDTLSADLSAYYTNQQDGWGRNLINGKDVNLAKDIAFRSKILWQPSDETKITLSGDFDHRRSDIGSALNIYPGSTVANGRCGAAPFPAGYPACPRQPAATFRGTIYDTQSELYGYSGKNGAQKAGTIQGGASLVIEHEASFATLRSLSSFRKLNGDQYVDQEGSPEPISSVTLSQSDKTFTQEAQIASAAGSRLKWIVGAFYMHRRASYDPFRPFGYSLGLPSPLDPAGQYGAPPRFGGSFRVDSTVTINSLSGYAQATLEVLPRTNVTAGVRYTSDMENLKATQTDSRGVVRTSADVDQTFSKLTYRLAVDHRFSEQAMIYASYNRGFKAGLFNTTNASGTFAGPETLDAFEVGLKTDLLDRRLRINLSGFHYSYDGLQLPIVVPGGTQTINAAKAKIDGLDFEVVLKPAAGLTLNAGGSRLFKAEYASFPNGPRFIPTPTGNAQVAADLSGNRIIRSPKLTGNVGLDYETQTDIGRLNFNTTYYYNSGFFWSPDEVYKQKRYGLLNMSIGWTSSDESFGLQVWGRNIGNKEYLNYVGPSTLGTVAGAAEPRTYGITGQFNF